MSANHVPRRCALIQFEVLASITLTIVLAALLSVATLQYAAVRRESDARRTLQFAAAAELDQIRAGLHKVSIGQPARPAASQPGEIALSTTALAGEGSWRGLARVHVVATRQISFRRTARVELTAYMALGDTR